MQNLLSSILLSKNIKIKIYRTIILPFVLYGCETRSLTFRTEEHMLGVTENRVLRRTFGPQRSNSRVDKTTLKKTAHQLGSCMVTNECARVGALRPFKFSVHSHVEA